MSWSKTEFLNEILSEKKRKAIPIMTSPGMELIGAKPRDVFQNADLQYRCIAALAEKTSADALVTFMDLSVEAEAFGSEIAFSEHENPTVSHALVSDEDEIARLAIPEVGTKRTAQVLRCAELCAKGLKRPTFGGLIGPYSLAGRLADMTEMMILAAAEPETAHALLKKTSALLKNYLIAMKKTGVAGAVIAEPAAGLISPEMCQEFSSNYLKEIIGAVKDDSFMVILHNCGNTEKQVDSMISTGADAIHVGNAVNILDILPQAPKNIPVMGNLDPVGVFKNATPEAVYQKTADLLQKTAQYPNYVLSSGCDLPPGVPMANVDAFFQALREYNSKVS